MGFDGQLKFIVQEAVLGTESELAFRNVAEPCGSLSQCHRAAVSVLLHFGPKGPLKWSGVKKVYDVDRE